MNIQNKVQFIKPRVNCNPIILIWILFVLSNILIPIKSYKYSQSQVEIKLSSALNAIYMLTASNNNITIFANNSINSLFIQQSRPLYCSQSKLYTYQQTSQQYLNNSPYYIYVQNSTPFNFNIYSEHQIIHPAANLSNCNSTTCAIMIQNGCPSLSILHYYDGIRLQIGNFSTISYDVICDISFYHDSFSFGSLIAVVIVIILLTFLSIWSRAWSIEGQGISVKFWMICVFVVLFLICGIIGYFQLPVLRVIVDIIGFAIGIIGVAFVCNQLLFLFNLKILLLGFKVWKINFRILEGISILIGLGMVLGWWFSGQIWILNDILCICAIIAAVKFVKFTSLKIATIGFCFIETIQIVVLILLFFSQHESQNKQLINQINGPIQLQIPTINDIYSQKCAWIPITSIAYQGIVLSYLRRFDTSRNTKVYMIIGIVVLSIGSLIWVIIALISPVNLPFGFVTDPVTLVLVLFFAYKRKQIRVIWDGKFYDQQFADRQVIEKIKQSIAVQRQMVQFRKSMFDGLQIDEQSNSGIGLDSVVGRVRLGSKLTLL